MARIPLAVAALIAPTLLGLGLGACHGQLAEQVGGLGAPTAAAPTAAAPATDAPARVPPAVADQLRRGAPLYAQLCARCHGGSGEGSAGAPPVIGAGALPVNPPPGARLRSTTFRSAKDVGMFIMTKMPPGGPRVPPTNVAAVLAYLLDRNGATPSQAVSPATAGSMPIHR